MTHYVLKADGLAIGLADHLRDPASGEEPIKRRRRRKPSLISVAKQAAKAGLEVARYEVDPDGKIIIVTGKTGDVTTGNLWDEVLKNVTD